MTYRGCCPICGSAVVYRGLRTVECSGTGCENSPNEKGDWRTFLMENIRNQYHLNAVQAYAKKHRFITPYPSRDAVKKILDDINKKNKAVP